MKKALIASCLILTQAEERYFSQDTSDLAALANRMKSSISEPRNTGEQLGYGSGESHRQISVAEQSCSQLQMQEPSCIRRLIYCYVCIYIYMAYIL